MKKITSDYIKKEYNSLAEFYEQKWKGYIKKTHDMTLSLIDFKKNNLILDNSILDISGGTGLLAKKILEKNNIKKFILIDISDEMIKIAIQNLKKFKNIKIIKQDVHKINLPKSSVSTVLSVSAFHYYENPNKVLKQISNIIKCGGTLIIVDWCRDSFTCKIYNYYKKIVDKAHKNIYTVNEMHKFLEKAGFSIESSIKDSYGFWNLMGIKAKKVIV